MLTMPTPERLHALVVQEAQDLDHLAKPVMEELQEMLKSQPLEDAIQHLEYEYLSRGLYGRHWVLHCLDKELLSNPTGDEE